MSLDMGNHYFGKTQLFYYLQLLIILFANDIVKKYGITHPCELGKGKFISGAADLERQRSATRSWLSYPTQICFVN